MKFLWGSKDGGPQSLVWMWGVESKRLGSVLLLKFAKGSREAYHTHAFNSVSWVLRGKLLESLREGSIHWYPASFKPVVTRRSTFHKVIGVWAANWILTIRGPWSKEWREFHPHTGRNITLTDGRIEVEK